MQVFLAISALSVYQKNYCSFSAPKSSGGGPAPQKMVVANIEAGPTKEEKVNALAESMQAAVQEVLGEDKKLTLVFHDNGLDRIAIGGVSVDPVLLCQAAEALNAAKPLPREAAELAAAVLWCALTLGTDRLFFRYDWRTPAFFVYKALFLVLAFGLVHGAVTLVQKLRAGDKFARRWVAWTLPYLAVNLVILLIVWPGIWGNDDLAVLYLARTLQPNSWQHFLTSGAFILSLMFVPMPGGVVLVQNLLISGIVGCFAATAQDLAEKRLTRPVRPAWFALVYLPFLLPPVLMHTQQPFRTTWSTWTELFLVFMLAAMYLRGTKLNKKELAAIVILGTLAASWRSECVYYLAAIPVLLALLLPPLIALIKRIPVLRTLVLGEK